MTTDDSFDVLVVGAGAGGVAAAARLARHGYRVLVAEAQPRVGGRASSREIEGFVLNDGALVIERDGAVADLYHDLGLELDLHVPRPDTVMLWGKRAFPASTGPIGLARRVAPLALRRLSDRFPRLRPSHGESTRGWIGRFTRSRHVHGLVDNFCGAIFAASGDDLPAEVFLSYMSDGSAFKRIGMVRGGTMQVWTPLLDTVTAAGGEVLVGAEVQQLVFDDDGRVRGAVLEHDGRTRHVRTRAVVSNAGPARTVGLAAGHLPADYVDEVAARTRGSAILTFHFISPVPLVSWPGIGIAARSRRLTYALNASDAEQGQVRRRGWHLYTAASTPRPATGDFDLEAEKELLLADIRDHFPGFDDHATIVGFDVWARDEPAQRAVSGHDLPVETPVPNLWNVGDGVKPWGDAGTSACVRSADAVVERIRASIPRIELTES